MILFRCVLLSVLCTNSLCCLYACVFSPFLMLFGAVRAATLPGSTLVQPLQPASYLPGCVHHQVWTRVFIKTFWRITEKERGKSADARSASNLKYLCITRYVVPQILRQWWQSWRSTKGEPLDLRNNTTSSWCRRGRKPSPSLLSASSCRLKIASPVTLLASIVRLVVTLSKSETQTEMSRTEMLLLGSNYTWHFAV